MKLTKEAEDDFINDAYDETRSKEFCKAMKVRLKRNFEKNRTLDDYLHFLEEIQILQEEINIHGKKRKRNLWKKASFVL